MKLERRGIVIRKSGIENSVPFEVSKHVINFFFTFQSNLLLGPFVFVNVSILDNYKILCLIFPSFSIVYVKKWK